MRTSGFLKMLFAPAIVFPSNFPPKYAKVLLLTVLQSILHDLSVVV